MKLFTDYFCVSFSRVTQSDKAYDYLLKISRTPATVFYRLFSDTAYSFQSIFLAKFKELPRLTLHGSIFKTFFFDDAG